MTTYREAWNFTRSAFEAVGASAQVAEASADALVGAQAWGVGSHGLIRVPQYLRRLRQGGTSPSDQMSIESDLGGLVVLDGHAGLGVFHLQEAAELGVERALLHGVSLVAVSNSSHCGALAFFAWPALRAKCAALLLTNGPAVMPPPGGSQALMSTSPICIAVPTTDAPIIVDMSTTAVARGKIAEFAARGEPLPPGWALAADGSATVDANVALTGMLAPLGGAKGAALAMGIEALTGGLVGPNLSKEVPDIFDTAMDSQPQGISHFVLTIQAEAIGEPGSSVARLGRFADAVRESGARLPGASKADPKNIADDYELEISPAVRAQLDEWADRVSVSRLP